MAGLAELTKRLKSVETAGQLAGAMKTVSAAKLSQVNSRLATFTPYADACVKLLESFGDKLSDTLPTVDANVPCAIVAFGSDRSLCGSYNAGFLPYLLDELKRASSEHNTKPMLFVGGKTAINHLTERGFEIYRACEFGDLPEYEDCTQLFDELYALRLDGRIGEVRVVYMRAVNSLTQSPDTLTLLSKASERAVCEDTAEKSDSADDPMLFPDRETVVESIGKKAECSALYRTMLESASSLHSATLVAMRSACDNADQLKLELSTELHRKRQSMITASVIETSSELTRGEAETVEPTGTAATDKSKGSCQIKLW